MALRIIWTGRMTVSSQFAPKPLRFEARAKVTVRGIFCVSFPGLEGIL